MSTNLPFMDGFEQFNPGANGSIAPRLQMAEWFTEGSNIAAGGGRYGGNCVTCAGARVWRDIPFGGALYIGVAVRRFHRGRLLEIESAGQTMVLYSNRNDGFLYLDNVNLEVIPLDGLWYYYEIGISGGNLTVRANDKVVGVVPLKAGMGGDGNIRIYLGSTLVIPPNPEGPSQADGATVQFDDFYANASGFVGTNQVQTRFPTGTMENDWHVNGAPAPHAAVGSIPFDQMNRNIASELAGDISEFMSNQPIDQDFPILATGMVMVARKPTSLNRAIEFSISKDDGFVTPRSTVVHVKNEWDMYYHQFPPYAGDEPVELGASPFAVELVNT